MQLDVIGNMTCVVAARQTNLSGVVALGATFDVKHVQRVGRAFGTPSDSRMPTTAADVKSGLTCRPTKYRRRSPAH
jgi:hypothetical protein